jgi:hypothetical protein
MVGRLALSWLYIKAFKVGVLTVNAYNQQERTL